MITFVIKIHHKPFIGIEYEVLVNRNKTTQQEEEKGEEFYLMCKAFNDKWAKEANVLSQSKTPTIFAQGKRPDPKNN